MKSTVCLRLFLFALAASLAVPPSARAKDKIYWFGDAYRSDVRFTVMSRQFTTDAAAGKRFVFLAEGPSNELEHFKSPVLASADVKAAVNVVLQKQGFKPATELDGAGVAIVVGYGRGFYPPPFAFSGVAPSTRDRDLPEALREYRDHFAPQWLENTDFAPSGELDRLGSTLVAAPRAESDAVNFITIKAYDWKALQTEKKRVPLWETRITTNAYKRPLEDFAAAMLSTAAPYLGSENRLGVTLRANQVEGDVKIGPLKNLGTVDLPVEARTQIVPDETRLKRTKLEL